MANGQPATVLLWSWLANSTMSNEGYIPVRSLGYFLECASFRLPQELNPTHMALMMVVVVAIMIVIILLVLMSIFDQYIIVAMHGHIFKATREITMRIKKRTTIHLVRCSVIFIWVTCGVSILLLLRVQPFNIHGVYEVSEKRISWAWISHYMPDSVTVH